MQGADQSQTMDAPPPPDTSSASARPAGLTDAHLDWVSQFCGVDVRDTGQPTDATSTADAPPAAPTPPPPVTDDAGQTTPPAADPGLLADLASPAGQNVLAFGGLDDVVPTSGAGDLNAPPPPATDATVYFALNSSDLTPSDQASLQSYVDRYVAAAVPTPIVLKGYASVDGKPGDNNKLSQARADAVKAFMTKTIKADLITAAGQGPTAQFQNGLAVANRCVDFGPPVAAAAPTPPAPDTPQSGDTKPVGDTQKVTTKCDPTPNVPLTEKQFTDIFGADLLGQWNAFRSKKGPMPPSAQLSLTLTLKGSLKKDSRGNLTVDWVDEPSIAVVFNSSGVVANDQEAISVFKMHWENTRLKRPVEVSLLGVAQNLFTSGASPGGGLQPQGKVLLTKQVGVVIGGSFMLGNDQGGKFGLNASGFMGIDVTAF
jgi:outer membrane protein OmpA-like peptidoglycan-associated protein